MNTKEQEAERAFEQLCELARDYRLVMHKYGCATSSFVADLRERVKDAAAHFVRLEDGECEWRWATNGSMGWWERSCGGCPATDMTLCCSHCGRKVVNV